MLALVFTGRQNALPSDERAQPYLATDLQASAVSKSSGNLKALQVLRSACISSSCSLGARWALSRAEENIATAVARASTSSACMLSNSAARSSPWTRSDVRILALIDSCIQSIQGSGMARQSFCRDMPAVLAKGNTVRVEAFACAP